MTHSTRWNIAVSEETDQALRVFLAQQGGRKGDLSRFVEEAVRSYILKLTGNQTKTTNSNTSDHDLTAVVVQSYRDKRK